MNPRQDEPTYPYICRECRCPVLDAGGAHRCERFVCPKCLGALSRLGFCAGCCERFEIPKLDPLEELAALKVWADRAGAGDLEKYEDALREIADRAGRYRDRTEHLHAVELIANDALGEPA